MRADGRTDITKLLAILQKRLKGLKVLSDSYSKLIPSSMKFRMLSQRLLRSTTLLLIIKVKVKMSCGRPSWPKGLR